MAVKSVPMIDSIPGHNDTIYVSGPMRGIPDLNRKAFAEVAAMLNADGWSVHNPHAANEQNGFSDEELFEVYIRADIKAILESSAICLLPGWHKSEGASEIEEPMARLLNLDIYYAFPDEGGGGWGYARGDIDWNDGSVPPVAILPSPREDLLTEAIGLITGDRNNQYGPPTQDFQRTADILNAMGYTGAGGRPLAPHDIALMVMAVKMSRLVWSPGKRDHWADMAGYAGCGWECVITEASDG